MGFRSWLRTPGVTGGILMCTAAGVAVATIGVTVALNEVAPKLPYPAADRLMEVWQTGIVSARDARYESVERELSPGLTAALAERADLFESVLAYSEYASVTPLDARQGGREVVASHDLIPRLGLRLRLGRSFTAEEDLPGHGDVIVLTHQWWRDDFGADPAVLGRSLSIRSDGGVEAVLTIVGVLDSASNFPLNSGGSRPWVLPLGSTPAQSAFVQRHMKSLAILAPDVPVSRARAAVEALGSVHADADRAAERALATERRPYETPEGPARAHLGKYRGPSRGGDGVLLAIILGLSLGVLAIASLNVATLTLARTTARRVELGVRAALGGGVLRLALGMIGEVLAIVAVGAVVGAAAAAIALAQMRGRLGPDVAVLFAGPDVRAIAAAIGATLLGALAAASWPAVQLVRSDPIVALRRGRVSWGAVAGEGGLRRVLALQVAATVVLCIGAGYFVSGAVQLRSVDRGFEPEGIVYALVAHGEADPSGRAAATGGLLAQVRALPGVRSASAGGVPIRSSSAMQSDQVTVDGTGLRGVFWVNPVLDGWLETMGIPLIAGRGITADEASAGAPVAVVSRVFAETAWPNESAVGRRLRVGREETVVEVVGVAEEIKVLESMDIIRQIYVPYALRPDRATGIVARIDGDAARTAAVLASLAALSTAGVALGETATLEQGLRDGTSTSVGIAAFFSVFALIGLILAASGMYGVMSYTMGRRRYELGLRLALGASPMGILVFSLREALGPLGIGMLVGGVGGVLLGFPLRSMIFGLSPLSPSILAPVAVLILAVGLGAALQPALRAAASDPAAPLRSD